MAGAAASLAALLVSRAALESCAAAFIDRHNTAPIRNRNLRISMTLHASQDAFFTHLPSSAWGIQVSNGNNGWSSFAPISPCHIGNMVSLLKQTMKPIPNASGIVESDLERRGELWEYLCGINSIRTLLGTDFALPRSAFNRHRIIILARTF